jgi:hypothetical protein
MQRAFLTAIALCLVSVPSAAANSRELSECKPLTRSGNYILMNDVRSDATCFRILDSGISLDLNGHSITYGLKKPKDAPPAYAVVGQACWDKGADPSTCGDPFSKLKVRNGTIIQGEQAPSYSHAIRLGQGRGSDFTFSDLEIFIHSPASVAIYSTLTAGGFKIERVTVHDDVKVIFNRHQIEGASVRIPQIMPNSSASRIDGLTIIGGPQGGIVDVTDRSIFSNNRVTMMGTYTNDFAIYVWGNAQQAYKNRIDGQGRGIQIYRGDGSVVRDNSIDVFEAPVNREYGGCQLGGSMGIQLEERSRNARIVQNEVRVTADKCDARAFRATDTEESANNHSSKNLYVAQRKGTSAARAVAASFGNAKDVTLDGDTLSADTANVEVDWDGADRIELKNVTFIKGDNPSADYATFRFWPGANDEEGRQIRSRVHIIDPRFENGASADSYDMHPIGFGEWGAAMEYDVAWTTIFVVTDSTGASLPRVPIELTSSNGDKRRLVTNERGESEAVPLLQFRRFNTEKGIETEPFVYEAISTSGTLHGQISFRPHAKSTVSLRLQ